MAPNAVSLGMTALLRQVFRRVRKRLGHYPDPDLFLRGVTGLIHVGANIGQERDKYAEHGLRVLWVEPVPEVFRALTANLVAYPNQIACQYLVTDQDEEEYAFNVANNNGESSSILDIKHHRDIWPEIDYERKIILRSVTLPTLIRRESIDLAAYQALVLDTQGAELLVLRGAAEILGNFRYVKLEVADFESYEGCCQLHEVDRFLALHGFRQRSRHKFAQRAAGGSYYDVIYAAKGQTGT